MTYQRGSRYAGKCPFEVVPGDPFSAESSIRRCVNCATEYNKRLESLKEDFYQTAMLTVLQETPKYDPNHPSGASFTTFIKIRVCTRLWRERKKELKYLPFPLDEQSTEADNCPPNPLVAGLNAEACTLEAMDDEVIRQLEVEQFCEHLPQILAKLSEKERRILEMKFFEEYSGVEIAKALGISEGRVSQITKTALEKVKKAYLLALEKGFIVDSVITWTLSIGYVRIRVRYSELVKKPHHRRQFSGDFLVGGTLSAQFSSCPSEFCSRPFVRCREQNSLGQNIRGAKRAFDANSWD